MTCRSTVHFSLVLITLLLSCFSSTGSIRIGFTHREQTAFEGLFGGSFPLTITIHTDVEPETDYSVSIRPIQEIRINNVATISPFATISCDADVQFGSLELEEDYDIKSGQIFPTSLTVNILNDFLVEEKECFTLELLPNSPEDIFTCSDDNDNSADYFCFHTICIEDDDDPNAPFNVVFEEDSYNVTEGETVTVCITIFSSPELDNATFDDVYAIVSLATSNDQPLEALNSDFQFVYGTETPLTPTERKVCFDVVTFNDTVLELMETTTLTLCVDDGGNQTVVLPTTYKAYLNIIDNNEAQIGLKMTEYNNSNDEICLTLMPVSSFNLEVLLIVDLEQAGVGQNIDLYKKSVVFPVGQTEVCTSVCSVTADNATFEISLSQTEDFNPRIHFVPELSNATVHNIVSSDVGIAWEENDYIVSGTSVVNVCVFVYSTLSLREVIIIMDIIPEGGNVTQYLMQLMSTLGERGCIDIDIRDTQCRNAVLTVSSDDPNVCILTESSSITIDISNTLCAPMTVGYEKMEYQVPASTTVTAVEFCAVITSPAIRVALRPFSLEISAPVNFEGLVIYQAIGDGKLSFDTNDSRQCHQFTIEIISSDDICDDFSMNIFTWVLSLRTGDGDIIVQPNSAKLLITDSDDLQCAPIYVGYSEMSYTAMEGEGVIVCIEITSHSNEGAPRPFSVMLATENGTADYDDFMQSSSNVSFEVGDTSQCVILSSIRDNICEYSECNYEYFTASLSTNDRHVFVAPSLTNIVIEEDLMTLNCSQLLADSDCMSPPPSSDSSNNKLLLYLYMFVPIGLVLILIIIVVVIVIVLIRRKKKKTVSLPKYHRRIAGDLGKLPPERRYIAFNEIRNTIHNTIPKNMIFTKDSIHLSNIVGQGESGVVYKAFLETKSGRDLVAIKTVKALFAGSDVNRLIKEIKVMVSFNHPNVMTLRGVCLDQENPLLIMPFMSNGSVLEYVKHHRDDLMLTEEADNIQISTARKKMLGMCLQVAKGMQYLAEERIVHRDLAACNCMIDMNDVIKVADFGLTEDIYASEYFRRGKSNVSSDEKVPLRWMAPESINSDLYNEKTDVWSFGVTCWEVFTCGQVPYHGIPVMRLFNTLDSGERLDKPNNSACSDEIFSVINACWNKAADERPNFKLLVEQISNELEIEAGYVDFSAVQQMN